MITRTVKGCKQFVHFLQGTSSSVIYVDPDAFNRNCTILKTLLPRESSSKVNIYFILLSTGSGGVPLHTF